MDFKSFQNAFLKKSSDSGFSFEEALEDYFLKSILTTLRWLSKIQADFTKHQKSAFEQPLVALSCKFPLSVELDWSISLLSVN